MSGECHAGKLFVHHDETLPCHQGQFGSERYSWIPREKLRQSKRELLDETIPQIRKVLSYLDRHREVLVEVRERFNGTNITRIVSETNLPYGNVSYILGLVSDVYWKLPKIIRKGDRIIKVGPPLAYR